MPYVLIYPFGSLLFFPHLLTRGSLGLNQKHGISINCSLPDHVETETRHLGKCSRVDNNKCADYLTEALLKD